jgi:hypothetical protein
MPQYFHGSNLNSGVTRKETYNLTNTGDQWSQEIFCNWANRNSNTPQIGSTNSGYILVSAVQEQGDNETCKITLTWEKPNDTTFDPETNPIPGTTFDEQTSYTELDIRQHPLFESTLSEDWDEENNQFNSSSSFYGVTSYIVGSTVVTKTEYSGSLPASNYLMVGKLETPGGGYSGGNKWLVIGSSRRKIGDNLYARETQYLYSDKGWDTTIYS